MAEVLLEKVPQRTQDMFNKGLGALERGHLDQAISLLTQVLELEPALLRARKFLRAAQIRQFKDKKLTAMFHVISATKGLPAYVKASMLLKAGKPLQALSVAERLLETDPLSPRFGRLLSEIAVAAGLPEAGVQTLEIVRDHCPKNTVVLKALGEAYISNEQTKEAREVFDVVCKINPKDPVALKRLKDVMALETMSRDGWNAAAEKESGGYRDLIKDEGEAVRLEQQAKAVRTDQDTDALIADTVKKIEAEPGNMNYYRALARLYSQNKRYDEAIATVEQALKMSPGDPELDNTRSLITLQRFDSEIAALREAGNNEGAANLAGEREQFRYGSLQERVTRYPNELRLRYELGVILFENDHMNEAIQQFQLSQRSPKDRILSLYYLAKCFHSKNQLDMALGQLKEADSELSIMDNTKKDVCYEIGVIAQEMGNKEMAAEYYKKIYKSDIGYKDIAKKIEQMYE